MIGVAVIALALLPPVSGSAATCPWLNAATAGGLLGVPVELAMTHAEGRVECAFSGDTAGLKTSLRINVWSGPKLETVGCSSPPIALKAIGNEAQACTIGSADDQVVEAVFGRVRDQLFRVDIATSNMRASRVKLQDAVHSAALHVAGNLF